MTLEHQEHVEELGLQEVLVNLVRMECLAALGSLALLVQLDNKANVVTSDTLEPLVLRVNRELRVPPVSRDNQDRSEHRDRLVLKDPLELQDHREMLELEVTRAQLVPLDRRVTKVTLDTLEHLVVPVSRALLDSLEHKVQLVVLEQEEFLEQQVLLVYLDHRVHLGLGELLVLLVFRELLVRRVHRVQPVTRAILELQVSLARLASRETQVRPGMLDLRDSVVMLDQSVHQDHQATQAAQETVDHQDSRVLGEPLDLLELQEPLENRDFRDQLDHLGPKVPLVNRVLKDPLDHLEAQFLGLRVILEQLEQQDQVASKV